MTCESSHRKLIQCSRPKSLWPHFVPLSCHFEPDVRPVGGTAQMLASVPASVYLGGQHATFLWIILLWASFFFLAALRGMRGAGS